MGVLSHLSNGQLFMTPYSVAHQVPLSMGILQARIMKWVAMPFSKGPSRPGIEPLSIMSPTLGGVFFTTSAIWEAHFNYTWIKYFFLKKKWLCLEN